MTKVLLITPEYPPGGAVGAARTVAFEKYLPEFGFQTAVLTLRSAGALPTDSERHVYRAPDAGSLYLPLTRRFLPASRHYATQSAPGNASGLRRALAGGLSRLRRLMLEWMAPDLQITWLPGALWMGWRAIQRERPALLYSSSPPETAHLVAGLLAGQARLPWVADFRDGWLFESLKPALRRAGWRRQLETRLEGWAVRRAAAIVAVSAPITDYFRAAYSDEATHKFHSLPNGYDPPDWTAVTPAPRPPGRMRWVHTGAFGMSGATRRPDAFLQALACLPVECRRSLEVVFVGKLTEEEKRLISRADAGDCLHCVGPVSKTESLGYQLSADALLLIAGQDKSVTTSKLYEYLYARRPILALAAPDGAAGQIVSQTEAGEVVPPIDVEAIALAVRRWMERWQTGQLRVQPRGLEQYERRVLTRQLAEIFTGVLSQARP